jgi:septal ring factor EnvC (AmiA/AmiB activator)
MTLFFKYKLNFYTSALALLFIATISFGQTKKKLEEKRKEIKKEISYTNNLIAETQKNTKVTLNKLIILNNKISKRKELINTINIEIQYIDKKIKSNNDSIEILTKELENLKDEYAKMIYSAYKNKNSYSRLMFIFASKDFNQAYHRLQYMQQYSSYRKKQAELIQDTKQLLNLKIQQLEAEKNEKKFLLNNQKNEKSLLVKGKKEKNYIIMKLQKKEKQLRKTLRAKEYAARKLKKAIEAIIAEEIRKTAEKRKNKPSTNMFALTPEELALSKTFSNNRGNLPWPLLRGIVSSTFGVHYHPVLKGIKIKNNGIDITTTKGSKVRTIFEGKVTAIISIPGVNGKTIIISHGEYLTVYSNLAEVYVKKGDKVKTKQNIGLIYTDTENAKTILQFQVWKGKTLLNPAYWLSGL